MNQRLKKIFIFLFVFRTSFYESKFWTPYVHNSSLFCPVVSSDFLIFRICDNNENNSSSALPLHPLVSLM